MRLLIFGSFLILLCVVIQTSVADSRNYKRSKYDEDNSVEDYKEKKYKYKHKTGLGNDDSEEKYKSSKRIGKPREEDFYFTEKNEPHYKKNKKQYGKKGENLEGSGKPLGKKKAFTIEDESCEDSGEEVSSTTRHSFKGTAKSKKSHNKGNKRDHATDDDESEEASSEVKFEKKTRKPIDLSGEEPEEAPPKKQFRKKIRVRVPDSPEDDSDESDEHKGRCEKKFNKGKRNQVRCFEESDDDGSGEVKDEPARSKRIRYSIKFAHEKEKTSPSEDDNIMMKIHRGDKKYKYNDDDDDGSSEEHSHPKRFHYIDDDDD